MSLAQALMNRPLKSTIPTTPEDLKPVLMNHDDFVARRKVQQQKQCEYHNRTARALPPLQMNEEVRMRKDPESEWEPAIMIEQHDTPSSYVVETEDCTAYRTNRKHLLNLKGNSPCEQAADLDIKTDSHSTDQQENTEHTQIQEQAKSPHRVSSFGRIIKPNPKYT